MEPLVPLNPDGTPPAPSLSLPLPSYPCPTLPPSLPAKPPASVCWRTGCGSCMGTTCLAWASMMRAWRSLPCAPPRTPCCCSGSSRHWCQPGSGATCPPGSSGGGCIGSGATLPPPTGAPGPVVGIGQSHQPHRHAVSSGCMHACLTNNSLLLCHYNTVGRQRTVQLATWESASQKKMWLSLSQEAATAWLPPSHTHRPLTSPQQQTGARLYLTHPPP